MPKRQTTPERVRKTPGTAKRAEAETTHNERRPLPDQIDKELAQAHERARQRTGADD